MERICHFQVTREIARGGTGGVLEALDTRLERRVATKLLIAPTTRLS